MRDDTRKYCPFCKSVQLERVKDVTGRQYVRCKICGARGPVSMEKVEADRLWNTRGRR